MPASQSHFPHFVLRLRHSADSPGQRLWKWARRAAWLRLSCVREKGGRGSKCSAEAEPGARESREVGAVNARLGW